MRDENDRTIIVQTLGTRPNHPLLDIMIWATALTEYKRLGYETLFVAFSQEDIDFLARNRLYELFSRIERLDWTHCCMEDPVCFLADESRFWSLRKMIAYGWALGHYPLECRIVEADADVLITKPLPFDESDCIVWGDDQDPQNAAEYPLIYPDWDSFSFANRNYSLPDCIRMAALAYNTGVLWIKDKDVSARYLEKAYEFMEADPSIKDGVKHWDCCLMANAEQRILRGILDAIPDIKVAKLSPWPYRNIWDDYSHYYQLRDIWRAAQSDERKRDYATDTMNVAFGRCLSILFKNNDSLCYYWSALVPSMGMLPYLGSGIFVSALSWADYSKSWEDIRNEKAK